MILEFRLDGPVDGTCFLREAASGEPRLVAGRFAKDCAALWLKIRGRRFGSYKKRKDAGFAKVKPKTGTFKEQRQLQKRALDSQAKQRGPWLSGASTKRMAEVRDKIRKNPMLPGKSSKISLILQRRGWRRRRRCVDGEASRWSRHPCGGITFCRKFQHRRGT